MCNPLHFIVTKRLYNDVKHVQKSHLNKGLASLANHPIPQADFRSTLITQISFLLGTEVLLHMYHDVLSPATYVSWCVRMLCGKPQFPRSCSIDAISGPIFVWLLAVIFEHLVLSPNQDPYAFINQTVAVIFEHLVLFLTAGLPMSYRLGPRWDDVITWSIFKSEAIFGFLSPDYTGIWTWFFW